MVFGETSCVRNALLRPQVRQHPWVVGLVTPTGEAVPEAVCPAPKRVGQAVGGARVARAVARVDDEPPRPIGWWCDVAAPGCLRPVPSTATRQYDPTHRCWHYQHKYLVCESCLDSGNAKHLDELQLVLDAAKELGIAP